MTLILWVSLGGGGGGEGGGGDGGGMWMKKNINKTKIPFCYFHYFQK